MGLGDGTAGDAQTAADGDEDAAAGAVAAGAADGLVMRERGVAQGEDRTAHIQPAAESDAPGAARSARATDGLVVLEGAAGHGERGVRVAEVTEGKHTAAHADEG